METYTLPCEKRDLAVKAKKLRRSGYVPAVVYGRHMDSLSIQIKQEAATKLLQTHSIGSKILLKVPGEDITAVLKEFSRDASTRSLAHIEFHALTSGERVKVTIPVVFSNKDSIEAGAYLHEQINEIEIHTLPEFLIDHVTVDLSKYSMGDSVHVSDLDVMEDKNIEVDSPKDTLLCTIAIASRKASHTETEPEPVEEAAEPGETTEE